MDKFKKGEEDRKEAAKHPKKNELKLKRAKEAAHVIDKENEVEAEDIEPVTLKIKDSEKRSGKKGETREPELSHESKTLPLKPLGLASHCENRGKRCRVSKML